MTEDYELHKGLEPGAAEAAEEEAPPPTEEPKNTKKKKKKSQQVPKGEVEGDSVEEPATIWDKTSDFMPMRFLAQKIFEKKGVCEVSPDDATVLAAACLDLVDAMSAHWLEIRQAIEQMEGKVSVAMKFEIDRTKDLQSLASNISFPSGKPVKDKLPPRNLETSSQMMLGDSE